MGVRPTSANPACGEHGLDEPARELDRGRILRPVAGDGDLTVPAGTTGTVVAVCAEGAAV